MSYIQKQYWKWDERLNQSDFKLGTNADDLISKGILIQTDAQNSFAVSSAVPWRVDIVDGKIRVLVYSENNFFRFSSFSLEDWKLENKLFTQKMDSVLERTDENYMGDLLYVVSRDYWVTLAMIIRRS